MKSISDLFLQSMCKIHRQPLCPMQFEFFVFDIILTTNNTRPPYAVVTVLTVFEFSCRSGECEPVCVQGCQPNGDCVAPDICQCHFGYVGHNCSTECECNRHSNCKSVEEKHHCLACQNNTQVIYKFDLDIYSIFGCFSSRK